MNASAADSAVVTEAPPCSSITHTTSRESASSSTTRMRMPLKRGSFSVSCSRRFMPVRPGYRLPRRRETARGDVGLELGGVELHTPHDPLAVRRDLFQERHPQAPDAR